MTTSLFYQILFFFFHMFLFRQKEMVFIYNEFKFGLNLTFWSLTFQMSGRAGRRGFDPVGNVVFFGVPYRKVQRLITANVPKIVGNFPINVSLVLRLLLITSKGKDQKDALTKVCRKNTIIILLE